MAVRGSSGLCPAWVVAARLGVTKRTGQAVHWAVWPALFVPCRSVSGFPGVLFAHASAACRLAEPLQVGAAAGSPVRLGVL